MGLDLAVLQRAVSGRAAAFRCITEYQPAGGPGDKIFPASYSGSEYATESRIIENQPIDCVLIDSVQSQANRMELALLDAHRTKRIQLPLIVTRFEADSLLRKFSVSSLEAPHRIADALFRDSRLDGALFRKSKPGRVLDNADIQQATGLFGLCPTGLLFGLWDSTGPRGGLGVKFQRALVSEIVGLNAVRGKKTTSRIDMAQISADVTIYEADTDVGFTTDPERANKDKQGNPVLFDRGRSDKGKPGNPSKANHSNVTPSIDEKTGGFTISKALQTTVLSLTALRRLRFPLHGAADSDPKVDLAARTTLAALGLTAAALARYDADLRSRCQLFAQAPPVWELLDRPGEPPRQFELEGDAAIALLNEAIAEAKAAGLPWEGEIELTPSDELLELVRRSQELAVSSVEGE